MPVPPKSYSIFSKKSTGASSVPEAYRDYYKSRNIRHPEHICHAPFNNMYFNTRGEVANCWLTFDDPEIYDGTRSIRDIWNGSKFSKLRRAISDFDLNYRCGTCKHYIESGNYVNVLAKAYDNDIPLTPYPSMMEFELSNTCNLECTMCNGYLSSAIRHNRDKLPALRSPYGEKFLEDLREFIPHLQEARFNGGEPFLIHIYYKIWDMIRELNPNLKIVVATNGTTLTPRVKSYMERGNFHINVSIDSLDPDTYSSIRLNANLPEVLENFEYFKSYCQSRGNDICVMVNPMRQNWQGLGDFVNFCNKHGVNLWYNTIIRPYDQALWNLPAEKLNEIYQHLASVKLRKYRLTSLRQSIHNSRIFENLVHTQIRNWAGEATEREKQLARSGNQEADPAAQYAENLETFIRIQFRENPTEAVAVREKIRDKTARMYDQVKDQLSLPEFYTLLNSHSPAGVFIFLLEHSDTDISRQMDTYLKERNC